MCVCVGGGGGGGWGGGGGGGGGGVFTKLKQCKQTTGPKSVVPGAEMHRTGGRNPSYHVIISHPCPNFNVPRFS